MTQGRLKQSFINSPSITSHQSINQNDSLQIKWQWVTFPKLGTANCYKVHQLRAAVFIDEQKYPFNDLDDRDQNALHLLGFKVPENKKNSSNQSPELIAYARLMWSNKDEKVLELGRVVVEKNYRKHGIGSELMRQIIKKMDKEYKNFATNLFVVVDEQKDHLLKFYQKFGFHCQEAVRNDYPNYTFANFDFQCQQMFRPAKSGKESVRTNQKSFFRRAHEFSLHFFGSPSHLNSLPSKNALYLKEKSSPKLSP